MAGACPATTDNRRMIEIDETSAAMTSASSRKAPFCPLTHQKTQSNSLSVLSHSDDVSD